MKIAFPTLRFGIYPKLPGEKLELEQTGKLFQWAKKVGFDGVELENDTFELIQMQTEELKIFYGLLAEYGLEAASVKTGGDLLTEAASYNEEMMIRAIQTAECLKAKIVSISLGENLADKGIDNAARLGGDFRYATSSWAVEEDYQKTAEAVKRICKYCEGTDVSLSLEIRTSSIADCSESVLKLYRMVDHPKLGLNPDLANVIWAYDKPVETWQHCLSEMAPYTNYFHVKNIVPLRIADLHRTIYKRGLLCDGTIDFRYVLQFMKEQGYQGYYVLEGPADGDKFYYFEEDYKYLKRLLQDIEY